MVSSTRDWNAPERSPFEGERCHDSRWTLGEGPALGYLLAMAQIDGSRIKICSCRWFAAQNIGMRPRKWPVSDSGGATVGKLFCQCADTEHVPRLAHADTLPTWRRPC